MLGWLKKKAAEQPRTYYVDQLFQCALCGNRRVDAFDSEPACCEQPMLRKQVLPADDRNSMRLHLIVADGYLSNPLFRTKQISWMMPGEPETTWELWRLAPGRINGERIGFLGRRTTCIEWAMAPGPKIRGGTATTVEGAVEKMLVAIDGGVHAKRVIAEIKS